LKSDGQLEEIPITIGAISDIQAEIVESELREGDTIVLNPPVEFPAGPPNR
jgi:hypothetical protein